MNFQNINFDQVEQPRRWPPQYQTAEPILSDSDSTVHPPRSRLHPKAPGEDTDSSFQSITPQPTVIPPAPSPPSPQNSTPEIYGPDRHRGPPARRYPTTAAPSQTPAVRFDESQLALFAAQNANQMSGIKDALTLAAGKVTPGVDDTPYIQYAIEALTRDRGGSPMSDMLPFDEQYTTSSSEHSPARNARGGMEARRSVGSSIPQPKATYAGLSDVRRPASMEGRLSPEPMMATSAPASVPAPALEQTEPRNFIHSQPTQKTGPVRSSKPSEGDQWVPVTKEMRDNFYFNDKANPPLTYKPRMIRPFSIMIFIGLCLFMVVALVLSKVFSDRNGGLQGYPGTIYSGQYFLYRLLPQLIAMVILLYAQSIVSTSFRILPFWAMANEDARARYLSLFQPLYHDDFFWPRLVGPWQMQVFSVAAWLALFTVPLASSAYTCILVDGQWMWAPVQGVAWALIVLYAILIVTAAVLMVFWFGQWTGLLWDVRSLGDLITLLNRSNTTHTYKGKEFTESPDVFKMQLRDRWFDRLGYWRAEDMQTGGIWYGIGASGTHTEQDPRIISEMMGKRASYDPSLESMDPAQPNARSRYLPLCLRSFTLIILVGVTAALLLALLVVSFLPQTRLEDGFRPLLSARPGSASFSAANFLYSFLPSLLGMVLFLSFQKLDMALRVVQPWGALSLIDGAAARRSILADYAACLPLQVTWRAARAGHWRVAIVSLMSLLSAAIPALAGGLFMALTRSDREVRMFPNVPVYGVLLAIIFLYVGGLTLLIPRRHQFRLPHAVGCLAEIICFCSAEGLTKDAAFRAVRSRDDLRTRLGVGNHVDPREESFWYFGILPGKNERHLSVRRMRRFTEKRKRSTRSMV